MRLSDNSVIVRGTADGHAFRQGAARLVAAHPVLHSVLATTLDHVIERPSDYPGARWYWATRGHGRWLAVAMHTPPRPFHLVTSDPILARAFAYRLREQGVQLTGVGGIRSGALSFAESWVDLGGAAAIGVQRREGLYDLPGPVVLTDGPGLLRAPTPEEMPLVARWADAYAQENHQPPPTPDTVALLDAHGGLRVWAVDGRPVSMVQASRPHAGVVRLSWVYTPAPLRGHRYASAAVSHAAAEQKQAGHRVILYTDLDNQPATRLYLRAGFRRIGDATILDLLAEEPVLELGSTPLRPTPAATPSPVTEERRDALAAMIRRARSAARPRRQP